MAENYNLWQQLIKDAVAYSPGSQAMRDTIQNLTNVLLANKIKRVEAPSFTTQQLAAMGNSGNFANQPSVKNFQEKLANSNNAYQQLQSQLVNPMANANFNRTFNVSPEEQARQSGAQLYGITQDNQRGTFISPTALRNYIGGASMALSPIAMGGLAGVGGNAGIFARLLAGTVGGAGEGFGMSTPNNALQGTLAGAGGGLVGTFAGELVSNPALRKNIAQGIKKANTGSYSGEFNLGDSDRIYDLSNSYDRQYLTQSFGEDGLKQILKTGKYKGRDAIEVLNKKGISIKGNLSGLEILDTLNPTGTVFTNYTPEKRMTAKLGKNITTLDRTMGKSPDTTITIYRGAPSSQKKINPGDFITTSYDIAKSYTGDGNVLQQKVRMSDILDDITDPLGEEYIYRPKKETAGFARLVDEALQEGERGEKYIRIGDTELPTKTPKLKEGVSYSKQAMLAKRAKPEKLRRFKITSDDEGLRESLRNTYSSMLKKR